MLYQFSTYYSKLAIERLNTEPVLDSGIGTRHPRTAGFPADDLRFRGKWSDRHWGNQIPDEKRDAVLYSSGCRANDRATRPRHRTLDFPSFGLNHFIYVKKHKQHGRKISTMLLVLCNILPYFSLAPTIYTLFSPDTCVMVKLILCPLSVKLCREAGLIEAPTFAVIFSVPIY